MDGLDTGDLISNMAVLDASTYTKQEQVVKIIFVDFCLGLQVVEKPNEHTTRGCQPLS